MWTQHIVTNRWGLPWRRQGLQVEEWAPEELEVGCLLFQWKCVWCLFEVHNPITVAQIRFLCKRQPSDSQCYWKKNTKQCLDNVVLQFIKMFISKYDIKTFFQKFPKASLETLGLYNENYWKAIKIITYFSRLPYSECSIFNSYREVSIKTVL